MKSYNIIYELLDDMRAAMEGRLAPSEERVPLGKAEVRAVFGKGSKLVAGCMVTDGQLRSESFITVSGGKAVMSVLLWHAHGVICQGRGHGRGGVVRPARDALLCCCGTSSLLAVQAATLPWAGAWSSELRPAPEAVSCCCCTPSNPAFQITQPGAATPWQGRQDSSCPAGSLEGDIQTCLSNGVDVSVDASLPFHQAELSWQ